MPSFRVNTSDPLTRPHFPVYKSSGAPVHVEENATHNFFGLQLHLENICVTWEVFICPSFSKSVIFTPLMKMFSTLLSVGNWSPTQLCSFFWIKAEEQNCPHPLISRKDPVYRAWPSLLSTVHRPLSDHHQLYQYEPTDQEYHPASLSLCNTPQWCTCCLLSYLKDAGSLSTNTCVTAYSEGLQLSRHLLSGAAHVDCILHTNANRKGQVQMFCFFPTSNIESEKQIDVLCMGETTHPEYRGCIWVNEKFL